MDENEENVVNDQSDDPALRVEPFSPSAFSPEQIAEWREQAAKAGENWQKYVQQAADFDNYKKRAARERQDAITYANESLLQKLVPILDNFEMALAAANNNGASAKSLQTGVNMIAGQLKNVLAEAGLEDIEAGGKKFDPAFHEAVSEVATTDVPEGHVAQQIRRGYKYRNRLVRPASVVVAKSPA
jgi:molecular chaperone GrpE